MNFVYVIGLLSILLTLTFADYVWNYREGRYIYKVDKYSTPSEVADEVLRNATEEGARLDLQLEEANLVASYKLQALSDADLQVSMTKSLVIAATKAVGLFNITLDAANNSSAYAQAAIISPTLKNFNDTKKALQIALSAAQSASQLLDQNYELALKEVSLKKKLADEDPSNQAYANALSNANEIMQAAQFAARLGDAVTVIGYTSFEAAQLLVDMDKADELNLTAQTFQASSYITTINFIQVQSRAINVSAQKILFAASSADAVIAARNNVSASFSAVLAHASVIQAARFAVANCTLTEALLVSHNAMLYISVYNESLAAATNALEILDISLVAANSSLAFAQAATISPNQDKSNDAKNALQIAFTAATSASQNLNTIYFQAQKNATVTQTQAQSDPNNLDYNTTYYVAKETMVAAQYAAEQGDNSTAACAAAILVVAQQSVWTVNITNAIAVNLTVTRFQQAALNATINLRQIQSNATEKAAQQLIIVESAAKALIIAQIAVEELSVKVQSTPQESEHQAIIPETEVVYNAAKFNTIRNETKNATSNTKANQTSETLGPNIQIHTSASKQQQIVKPSSAQPLNGISQAECQSLALQFSSTKTKLALCDKSTKNASNDDRKKQLKKCADYKLKSNLLMKLIAQSCPKKNN